MFSFFLQFLPRAFSDIHFFLLDYPEVESLPRAHSGEGSRGALLPILPHVFGSWVAGIDSPLASHELSTPAPPLPPMQESWALPMGVWSHWNVALWPLAVKCPGQTWPGKQEGLREGEGWTPRGLGVGRRERKCWAVWHPWANLADSHNLESQAGILVGRQTEQAGPQSGPWP